MDMGINERIRSCFVVEVAKEKRDGRDVVVLIDSTHSRYYIDPADIERTGFDRWIEKKFMAGVAQTVTVFRYEVVGEGVDRDSWIREVYGVS